MTATKWDDLRQRLVSGLLLAVVGLAAVSAGGVWFQMVTVFVTAVMVWELWMMIRPGYPTEGMLLAAVVASILSGLLTAPGITLLPLILLPAIGGAAILPRERATFLGFAIGIMIAGWGLVSFRETYGVLWIFWLVLVVVVTDIAGYFAGRMIGGPKFWPSLSPKKTWSGTAAGWIGSALLGVLFLSFTNAGRDLIWISVMVSFASQMGDITESALKRRMGVKDSSSLIPGHGGLFDRFDGLLGASLVMLLASLLVEVPQVDF